MSWTDREILVCLLNVMEYSNVKLEFGDAPYPAGRNASGFRQKISALKRELQPEFESIKAGNPFDSTPKKRGADDGTPKATPRKRKVATDGNGVTTPMKRKRPKKTATPETEWDNEEEIQVKDEPKASRR